MTGVPWLSVDGTPVEFDRQLVFDMLQHVA